MRGWILKLVCPGYAMSISHEKLLLLKNATVNWNLSFSDVCTEKHVIVAYNNRRNYFEVSDYTGLMESHYQTIEVSKGKMVKYPLMPYIVYRSIAREWEIQMAFFEFYNIQPKWLHANQIWGTLNDTTGQWSGAVGMIQRDEADYAIPLYEGAHRTSKVAAFSATLYAPYHWLTRYPQEHPPTWNLLGLFTKGYISQMSFQKT